MAKIPFPRSKILRGVLILIGTLLLIPPVQVFIAGFANIPWSPMQTQRVIEARWEGKTPPEKKMEWLALSEIPVAQIHFIWASEDQSFFKHGGFDLDELKDALERSKKSGKGVRGASTISMQCARSVFLWQGRSYVRKALEAYYTFWMEVLLSKQRILELYLNHIETGPGVYGVGAAAKYYFNKPLSQLSTAQMAAIAAILPNPLEWSAAKPNATVQKKIRRVRKLAGNAPFPVKELGE